MSSSTPQMLMLDGLRIGEWILDGCETTRGVDAVLHQLVHSRNPEVHDDVATQGVDGRRPTKADMAIHRAAPSIAVRSISSDLVTGFVCRCPACWMAKIGVVSQWSGKTTTRAVAPSGHELSFPPKEAICYPPLRCNGARTCHHVGLGAGRSSSVPRTLEGPFGRLSFDRASHSLFSTLGLVRGARWWAAVGRGVVFFLSGFCGLERFLVEYCRGEVQVKRCATTLQGRGKRTPKSGLI